MIDFRKASEAVIRTPNGKILLKYLPKSLETLSHYKIPASTQRSVTHFSGRSSKGGLGDPEKFEWDDIVEEKAWNESTLFISYARSNNKLKSGRKIGWVEEFVKEMEIWLGEIVRPSLDLGKSIWMDDSNLRGNEPLTETIKKNIEATQVFIAVLSPAYIKSPYCMQELECFKTRPQYNPKKLFFIEYADIESIETKKHLFNDCLGYQLYCPDNNLEYENTDQDYRNTLRQMSKDISKELDNSNRHN